MYGVIDKEDTQKKSSRKCKQIERGHRRHNGQTDLPFHLLITHCIPFR